MGNYYIGTRLSDIAVTFDAHTTDDFFAGSITCYGNNKNGNIAYNVISGIQLSDNDSIYGARNDAIYSKFFANQCRKIAAADPDARFLPYSDYYAAKVPAELRGRIICFHGEEVCRFLNSKFNFKKFIAGRIPQSEFEIMSGKKVLKLIESGEVPARRQVVIQTEYSAGGEGTVIATREFGVDKTKINPKVNYVVSEYIENMCSASVHILISANEIAAYPPNIQIMKGPSFVGSDLFAFSKLDEDVKNECIETGEKFGRLLREKFHNFQGYIGIDIIITKSGRPRVFLVETNARFDGTTGLLNILCHMAGIGSVYGHAYEATYAPATNFGPLLAKITPNGRKRYAQKGEDISHVNKEGLDETGYQEDGFYTHAVFEEVAHYNVFDDRKEYKKYVSRHTPHPRR
jgi:hypothetical protein